MTLTLTEKAEMLLGELTAAHLNEFFCVPHTSFLGVTPQDIIDYKLPTHPLKDVDIKRAKDFNRLVYQILDLSALANIGLYGDRFSPQSLYFPHCFRSRRSIPVCHHNISTGLCQG